MKIKHISPSSAGKTLGVAIGFVALVIGVVVSLWHLLAGGRSYSSSRYEPLWVRAVSNEFAFVTGPLYFFILGYIIGFVVTVAFNMAAGVTGGLDVEVTGEDAAGPKEKEFDW